MEKLYLELAGVPLRQLLDDYFSVAQDENARKYQAEKAQWAQLSPKLLQPHALYFRPTITGSFDGRSHGRIQVEFTLRLVCRERAEIGRDALNEGVISRCKPEINAVINAFSWLLMVFAKDNTALFKGLILAPVQGNGVFELRHKVGVVSRRVLQITVECESPYRDLFFGPPDPPEPVEEAERAKGKASRKKE